MVSYTPTPISYRTHSEGISECAFMGVFIQTACKGFAGVFPGLHETTLTAAHGAPGPAAEGIAVVLIGSFVHRERYPLTIPAAQ
jgi:TctA family transporter